MRKKWVLSGIAATMLVGPSAYAQDVQPPQAAGSSASYAGGVWGSEDLTPAEGLEENRTIGVFLRTGKITFQTPPVIEEGNTLAPYGPLLERLGFETAWDEKTGTVSAEKRNLSLRLTIGSDEATVNGEKLKMPAAPKLLDGVPYIPLRFVAEADKREVRWDGIWQEISIGEGQDLTELRIVYRTDSLTDQKHAEAIFKKVEEETGIRLELIAVPAEHYQQKLNLMIAANDLPDLLFVPDQTVYPQTMLPGIFRDLTDELPKFPNLDKLSQQAKDLRIEGRLFGLAKLKSPYDERFPALRADWLKPLDLELPQTMDELYKVMADFKSKDPDGNGRNDTIGMAGNVGSDSLGDFAWVEHVFNESAGRFKLADGKIVDTIAAPGELEALQWLSRAFRDGLLKGDFAKDADSPTFGVAEGNAGIGNLSLDEAVRISGQLRQTAAKADVVPLPSLQANGKTNVVPVGSGQAGMFAIPYNVSEAKTVQILSFLERLAGTGSAGDFAEGLSRQTAKQLDQTIGWNAGGERAEDAAAAFKQAVLQEREKLSFDAVNPVDGRLLEAKDKAKLHELDVKTTEMKLSYIIGKISTEQWHAYVQKLTNDPAYTDILKKLNEAFAKMNAAE